MKIVLKRLNGLLSLIVLFLTPSAPALAQFQYGWVMPRESPPGAVSQTVGVTEIMIEYHRPAVKGREIWGKLEPYDKVWRAGANEATTISFSTDVKIEGQPLPAGTYGLFMIPTPAEWTIIFSKNAKQWGAFTYKPAQDALRVKVKPQSAELQERLQYSFPVVTENSAQIVLQWEKLKIPFTVTVDAAATALAKAKAGFSWESGWFAANYFLEAKTNLEDALKFVNASIGMDENSGNLILKAKILAELNRYDEALQVAGRALALADKSPATAQARIKESVEKLISELKKRKG